MSVAKEFTVRQEDKRGTFGKLCQALADQNVNILPFQSFPSEKGKSSIHLILDNHTAARAALDQQRADYTETEVAHVKLAHRPGELGRATSRLGDPRINLNYGYCRTEAVTNASILILVVADAGGSEGPCAGSRCRRGDSIRTHGQAARGFELGSLDLPGAAGGSLTARISDKVNGFYNPRAGQSTGRSTE